MAIEVQETVNANKVYTLIEGQKIAISFDGVEDGVMTFTVPAGKIIEVTATLGGQLRDISP